MGYFYKNKAANKTLAKIFAFCFSLFIVIKIADYLLPKQDVIFTVLWPRIEIEESIRKRKSCFIKYSTGNIKSGRWVEKKVNHLACNKIESGKTYKVSMSAIMRSWFINSINEVQN